jgi:hypothetical protein
LEKIDNGKIRINMTKNIPSDLFENKQLKLSPLLIKSYIDKLNLLGKFEESKVNLQGIEQYPTLLRAILEENAYVDKPLIVVLTPGRFNSAYYEHSFLAREMDVPLVMSRDLFVENDRVFVKTIRGLKVNGSRKSSSTRR